MIKSVMAFMLLSSRIWTKISPGKPYFETQSPYLLASPILLQQIGEGGYWKITRFSEKTSENGHHQGTHRIEFENKHSNLISWTKWWHIFRTARSFYCNSNFHTLQQTRVSKKIKINEWFFILSRCGENGGQALPYMPIQCTWAWKTA